MKSLRHISVVVAGVLLFTQASASAQMKPDSLRRAYDFQAAVEAGQRALEGADSLTRAAIEEDLILSQNGLSMMDYCSNPVVVAKYRFSIEDFFLFYPMRNRSWRPVPNQLDSLGGSDMVKAMYIPDGEERIFYSAMDKDGIRNIYRTELRDSLWTIPALTNEHLTSSSDEIFPVLSDDGKSLYFASKGLYGMGGYDLYVSRWNEEQSDWGMPVNLGFPYSSPYDDFLFINTDDGRYSMFASNRECPSDSVYIYVLEYDNMPLRKKVGGVEELRVLASLVPQNDPSKMNYSQAVSGTAQEEDANVLRYMEKMDKVRGLRDSISIHNRNLDKLRTRLTSDEVTDRQALTDEIMSKELAIPAMQARLELAVKELQQIELDFLSSGVVIDPDKLKAEADREVAGTATDYVFSKNEMGPDFHFEFEEPVSTFDYSFKVLEQGQFAEDNTLPAGLIYQIQIFTASAKATVEQIKGLSPVFEHDAAGKHMYAVGLFKTYADVLSHLNSVKKAGFKSAVIVAFRDGEEISVSKARSLEATAKPLYKIRIIPDGSQSLPEAVLSALRESTDADIARVIDNGSVAYEIGPIDDRDLCETILAALEAAGLENISIIDAGQTLAE